MISVIRVALDVPVPRLFDYLCADAHEEDVGARVLVSFGPRQMVGIIVEVATDSALPLDRLKSCERILRDLPPLPGEWIALAKFCSEYYQMPIGEALLTALPPRLRRAEPLADTDCFYSITVPGRAVLQHLQPRQKILRRILEALLAKPQTGSQLTHTAHTNRTKIRECIANLWIEKHTPPSEVHEFVIAHPLNEEQSNALEQAKAALKEYASFLLFGITGSGKTEVYLNLIAHVISEGRQALVLVPEIALTPSLESLFRERFPTAKLCIQHSEMGQVERAQSWVEASQGKAHIVLGTRLAVFVPMPRLGLIVVDEEQDSSYKQQDGLRYSARDLAIFKARQWNVPALLCSATPSLETLHHAHTGRYRLLRLTKRAHKSARLPAIHLVDTRKSLNGEGLSEPLLQALTHRLERREQSVLFLNRRGFAPVLACGHCGWVSGCPRCSVNLVMHLAGRVLRCHHCGFHSQIPRACPQCGNLDLAPLGRGTERLETEVTAKFPHAHVLRIDSDSSRGKLRGLLETAHSGDADILVGTQLLAKGHHFERVTLVGVLNADAGLFAADYRAPERLFAQLQQVAGRAGRANLPGEVFIQTRFPLHPLYRALQQQNYEGYARELLEERRTAGFPPFIHEAALRAQAPTMETSLTFLKTAVSLAPEAPEPLTIYDPAPASLSKLAGLERAQLVVQSHSRPILREFLRTWNKTLCALQTKVRWHFDVDPIEF